VDIDTVRDEAIPRLVAALKKVPSDSPAGAVGSRDLRDRLKRMELSALNQVPLRGAVEFHKHLGENSPSYTSSSWRTLVARRTTEHPTAGPVYPPRPPPPSPPPPRPDTSSSRRPPRACVRRRLPGAA
ncbi:unnamed protein product, partial [Prorocentrum cordatum]